MMPVATLDGETLTLENDLVLRHFVLRGGRLFAASLVDKAAGREWCAGVAGAPSFAPPWEMGEERSWSATLQTLWGTHGVTEGPSLLARLTLRGPAGMIEYTLQMFPGVAGVTVALARYEVGDAAAAGSAHVGAAVATGVEAPASTAGALPGRDTLDVLAIAGNHLALTAVTLVDQTDVHDNLVFEKRYLLHPAAEPRIELGGNVFALEDRFTGDGLVWLKHAPLPHARPVKNAVDCAMLQNTLAFLGHNLDAAAPEVPGYASTLLAYSGGAAGRTAALHTLQRAFRPYDPTRDARFLSNTWGDRGKDGRVSEAFMAKEIAAGEKLGVDVVQIDDGWQRGVTANSVEKGGVWNSFWEADANFWGNHPTRFPNGVKPTVDLAAGKGMAFGLWFAPDSSNSFSNWKKDADTIIDLHRTLGVNYIKIDGVKATTRRGEVNLRRFFDAVLDATAGKVSFDLDVTAEIRPGYFGLLHTGPIFVENRYTDFHRYYPHATLRNLWQLAHYVDPARLRMEFLNNTRHADKYADDPLAPGLYGADYLFASVMLANPLGWFEVSNLPAEFVASAAPLVALWKKHRDVLFTNQTLPIGQEPSGLSFTGFLNHGAGRSYVLVFRERTGHPTWSVELPLAFEDYAVSVLAGRGSAVLRNGTLSVDMPEVMSFLWVMLER